MNHRLMKPLTMLVVSLCLAPGLAFAADERPGGQPYRVVLLSNLPEVVTYQDQGFSDFIRETKRVPTQAVDIAEILRGAVEASLGSVAKGQGVSVQLSDARSRSEREQPLNADAEAAWVRSALSRPDVDAAVVVGEGTTRFERFVKGVSLVTKIGLLGIEKLTMVFSMPDVAVYVRGSDKPCSLPSAVRRTRIPAIYNKWADDMANGPSDAVHAQAQATIARELPLAIQEAVDGVGSRVAACLAKGRATAANP